MSLPFYHDKDRNKKMEECDNKVFRLNYDHLKMDIIKLGATTKNKTKICSL